MNIHKCICISFSTVQLCAIHILNEVKVVGIIEIR